jgi:hypothetical protein
MKKVTRQLSHGWEKVSAVKAGALMEGIAFADTDDRSEASSGEINSGFDERHVSTAAAAAADTSHDVIGEPCPAAVKIDVVVDEDGFDGPPAYDEDVEAGASSTVTLASRRSSCALKDVVVLVEEDAASARSSASTCGDVCNKDSLSSGRSTANDDGDDASSGSEKLLQGAWLVLFMFCAQEVHEHYS